MAIRWDLHLSFFSLNKSNDSQSVNLIAYTNGSQFISLFIRSHMNPGKYGSNRFFYVSIFNFLVLGFEIGHK